jgi:peptidoglycan/xylan/chitin deacetylase (PgdA/CDA1 family)
MTIAREILRRARTLLGSKPRTEPGPVILLYHRIAEEAFDPWALAVSPEHFSEQMRWVGQNRSVLPITEFARRHREGSLAPDAMAITFDDGYACNAHVAAPILQRFGLPATIFLPAEIIETGRQFWWDELQDIVIDNPASTLKLDGRTVVIGPKDEADAEWQPGASPRTERQRAFLTIWAQLRTRTTDGLDCALKELRGDREKDSDQSLKRPMTVKEIRSVETPVEFGSHALTHRSLPALNPADRAREISESLDRCELLSGYRPRSFAYPFGDADADSIRLVEEIGFECACITGERSISPGSDMYALPRIGVGNLPVTALSQTLGHA